MKFLTMFKSRTVWTAIVLIILNGVPAIRDMIPLAWLPVVDLVLGALAIYFRVNPKQTY